MQILHAGVLFGLSMCYVNNYPHMVTRLVLYMHARQVIVGQSLTSATYKEMSVNTKLVLACA